MAELALEKHHVHHGQYPQFRSQEVFLVDGVRASEAVLLYQLITGDGNNTLGGTEASNGRLEDHETPILETDFVGGKDKFGLCRVVDGGGGYALIDGWERPIQYRQQPPVKDSTNQPQNQSAYYLFSYGSTDPFENNVDEEQHLWIKNW